MGVSHFTGCNNRYLYRSIRSQEGNVIDGTRTAAFRDLANIPVHIPLSGKTMEFWADGACIAGC